MATKVTQDPINLPVEIGGHLFPGIWQYVLPEKFMQMDMPAERKATCDNCPNICSDEYNPTYRCCSYQPLVPNFLVGLAWNEGKAREKLKELNAKGYLIPEGFYRTPHQWVDYIADLGEEKFGKSKRVQCPMLNPKNGLCGIYAFRNAACSTFYCRNDHGERGEKFWVGVEELVSQIELALSQWVMEELGMPPKKYYKLLDSYSKTITKVADPKTKGWNEEIRKALWGKWYGKEFEFFAKCGQLVADNRDKLWDISNSQHIYEAHKFDQAMNGMVPKEFEHEIDPRDMEETGDAAPPEELFQDLKKLHKKLTKLPNKLKLNGRAEFLKNPKKDKEDKYFKDKPYLMEFMTKKGGNVPYFREYLGKDEFEALKLFKRERRLDIKLLKKKEFRGIPDPEAFLSEWHGKQVLQKA